MRILYLHQYFNTPHLSGATRSYEMARRLAAAGHEVHMITSSRYISEKNKHWIYKMIEGIHVHRIFIPYSNKMGFGERIFSFFRFSWEASKKIIQIKGDVVYATSTPLTIAVPAIAAKMRHRIPMVFEVRDLWPELPIAVGALRNPFSRMLAGLLEWLAYHASAHVIALSPGMAAGVKKRGISSPRVSVIPNGCDVELFDVPAEKGAWVRRQLGLVPDQPLVVYTGAFGMINGVGYLVDTAAAMRDIAPEVRFLLAGSGAEKDKVSAKAERLSVLNKNLWIWPPQPKAKVPGILAASTVAVSLFISLEQMWSNSANKFFDALAAGKPVAINYGGWQAGILRKSRAGIVLPPDDPKRAASRLAEFIHEPERLKRAASASRRLARGQFNRDLSYEKLENVLQNAAAKR